MALLQPGDVMTREFGWDRDVIITHPDHRTSLQANSLTKNGTAQKRIVSSSIHGVNNHDCNQAQVREEHKRYRKS
ncbi:MAG: hypothetical protein R3B41_04325 [Candidatus Doudnabacteria bacterium]